jgi:hypothetical protein
LQQPPCVAGGGAAAPLLALDGVSLNSVHVRGHRAGSQGSLAKLVRSKITCYKFYCYKITVTFTGVWLDPLTADLAHLLSLLFSNVMAVAKLAVFSWHRVLGEGKALQGY